MGSSLLINQSMKKLPYIPPRLDIIHSGMVQPISCSRWETRYHQDDDDDEDEDEDNQAKRINYGTGF